MTRHYLISLAIFISCPLNAKTVNFISDSFGMEFFIDGKPQTSIEHWTLICNEKGHDLESTCILQVDSIHCGLSNHFNSDHQTFTADRGAMKVVGNWIFDGILTTTHKDGPEDWTCQFWVNDKGTVVDAKCHSKFKGKEAVSKMPSADILLSERCKDIKFRGKPK